MYTLHQLRQRASEWNQPLWVAATDFKKKALDTVEHSSTRRALREQGIEEFHIQILAKLYEQRATVQTRQMQALPLQAGDQARPAQHAFCSTSPTHMKPPSEKWKREKRGVRLAEHDSDLNFSNLRFCRRPHSRRLAHLIATRPPC